MSGNSDQYHRRWRQTFRSWRHASHPPSASKMPSIFYVGLRGTAPTPKMERTSRWLLTHTSQILDYYGRYGVDDVSNTFPKSHAKSVHVSSKDFVTYNWSFSLGEYTFVEFGGKPCWPTPSPLSLMEASAASVAWASSDDPWPSLPRAWFAMLALPGFLRTRRLGWPCNPQSVVC